MSSVVTPNGRLLVIAGNLVVEDTLTVRSNAEFSEWILANNIQVSDSVIVNDSVITTNIDADLGSIDELAVDTLQANVSVTTPLLNSENIINSQNIESPTIEATTKFTGAELEITGPTTLTGCVTIVGDTSISGTFTLNGDNVDAIGEDGQRIEFYFGEEANITQLFVETANIQTINTEALDLTDLIVGNIEGTYANIATVEIQDLTVTGNIEYDIHQYYEDYPVAQTVYVRTDGNDAYDGRSLPNAVRTIEKGLEIATQMHGSFNALEQTSNGPILVSVYPGVYEEDGSLYVPDRTAVVSAGGQYATEVHMSAEGRTNYRNMFLLGSGCYVQGFSFRNMEIDDFDDPKGGFAIAFRPGAFMTRSCYIRDCSQVSNYADEKLPPPLDPENANPLVGKGGGVLLADRLALSRNSIFPYMLGFGATPRSQNGIGYCAKNGAGINGIGSLGIFQRICFFALNGGQLTLNNSGTQFGDISMRSSGNMLVVQPDEVSSDVLLSNVSAAESLISSQDTIIDAMWLDLVNNGPEPDGSPNGTGNASWTDGFVYDSAICSRDLGYIIKAVTLDLALGSTFNTITAGSAYLRGASSYVLSSQFDQTIAAMEELREEIKDLAISQITKDEIDDLFQIIIETMQLRIVPKPVFGTSLVASSNEENAFALLRANKILMQNNLTAWVNSTYPTLTYDEAKCKRDIGYIIDAVSHDIYYGGNYASNRAGDAYFSFGVPQVGAGEETYTVAAYNELISIISDVLAGTYPGQDLADGVATVTEATIISDLITDNIINVISSGIANLPAENLPDVTGSTLFTDYTTIVNETSTLQGTIISWIDTTFATFYEDKTKRDAGDLILALSLDLRGGIFQVSKAFILGLFWHNAEYAFPEAQISSYVHTWNYIKDQIEILYGTGSDEFAMVSEIFDAIISTLENPTRIRFSSLLESLAHQFNNAGAGVNSHALPLNFRKPGFNRAVPYSILQENGGRIRWSGADELNNQYFAGGTRINGLTGKFEGRPFDISVRQIARRLANSRGSY